ncbi:MAG: DNA segregation ATPase FtsK/SpoIIIE-like protein [Flavobacteriales bacterium]|jgi:DNA segregation ATPase FtsK/SpoIIIE-like protein
MQFRHPELLYALLLLIIPILVHLFQLRKFKKEAFTNVAFLKKVNIQTRKSNTIKKWLILLTRMLALAMIVLAFAQPFLTQSDVATKAKETVVYLDNSFSMQSKGKSGPLLNQSVQDLITHIPEDTKFTLLTNTDTYKNISVKGARNTLLQIPYSSEQLTTTAISLKAKKAFSKDPSTEKRLIVISDFQDKGQQAFTTDEGLSTFLVQLTPETQKNISIDSIYVSASKVNSVVLTASFTSESLQETNVPVSIYNNKQLLAKGTAAFDESTTTTVNFEVATPENIEGRIEIDDPSLTYDNTLFFNVNATLPVKVLSINDADDNFLARVFRAPDFMYANVLSKNLDFSSIDDYNLVVLNEVRNPSAALSNAIRAFTKAGGSVLIIPSVDPNSVNEYSNMITTVSRMQLVNLAAKDRLITSINYDHPLYRDVFENKIKNFQYPSINSGFTIAQGEKALSFEDGSTFLGMSNSVYVFAGALNTKNSNFKNSPLIVPTLYNIGKQSLRIPQLYFNTGRTNIFDIPITLQNDAIVSLNETGTEQSLIPLQQTFGNKVTMTTTDAPSKAAIYNVTSLDNIVQQVSYNYDRSESRLRYQKLEHQEGLSYHSSVRSLFDSLKETDDVQSLWKWFVIFALGCLLMEMLILKFFK